MRLGATALAVAALSPSTSHASIATTAGGSRSGAIYVALGDSYAAGEGLGPFEAGTDVKKGSHRNQCHRSARYAYADLSPAVVLPAVTSRAFWACSGATTSEMQSVPPQNGKAEQYGQPDQTQMVGPATQWITVQVGGDDTGFGAIGMACGGAELAHRTFVRIPREPSCTKVLGDQTAKLAKLEGALVSLYDSLLVRAPSAKLVVVGYPRVFPSSYKGVPIYQKHPFCVLNNYGPVAIGMPVTDAQAVDRFEQALNATIRNAAAGNARIRFADAFGASTPINCKGTTRHASVAGLELSPGFNGIGPWWKSFIASGTFHPTRAGQVAIAKVVQASFLSFPLTLPANVTLESSPLPDQPLNVGHGASRAAFDSSGTLWVTVDEGLERVDPSTGQADYWAVEGEQDDGSGDIALGPDGNVWFTSLEQVGTTDDPGDFSTFDNFGPNRIQAIGLPDAIAAGPDGGVWFADESIPAAISEIDAFGDVTSHLIPTDSAGWRIPGLVTGPDGALWFTEAAVAGTSAIGRMTTDGTMTSYSLPRSASPDDITVGPDGALWFTDLGTDAIGRITTSGQITEYPLGGFDRWGPFDIAAADGALWFTTETHVGEVTTDGQIKVWPVSGAQQLAGVTPAADGSLWVMDLYAGLAHRLTP